MPRERAISAAVTSAAAAAAAAAAAGSAAVVQGLERVGAVVGGVGGTVGSVGGVEEGGAGSVMPPDSKKATSSWRALWIGDRVRGVGER